MVERYRHTQFGHVTTAGLLMGAIACAYAALVTGQRMLVVAGLIMAALLLLFATLTTAVRDGQLEIAFGVGLIRRRVSLDRIADVSVVRTPWYWGWGIRWTPWGWLWNVSGTRGVEVRFNDGRRFRIGSDEPERLASAILAERPAH